MRLHARLARIGERAFNDVNSCTMQLGAKGSFANTKWRLVFRSRRSMGLDEEKLSCCEPKIGKKNNLTSRVAL